MDACGIPGWDRVNALAEHLMEVSNDGGLSMRNQAACKIVSPYDDLLDYDKGHMVATPRYKAKQVQ